ncbi:MAG TPA: rod shape-determining protein [Ruminococcaceae bacterium]|nr:rod shape-determining protein [Oscillospiraceae bacterium]
MSSVDIGIDLGTANTIITIGGKGIVVDEPSVVAYDKKKHQVLAVGAEAYKMLGRTPEYIIAVKPLKDGVISDNDTAEAMVAAFIRKVSSSMMLKPRIILCVPSLITDVENRAVIEAALSAGARKVFIIKEPIAALIGAGVDISKAKGAMVVDIGGGTTDIAVTSFNGIVQDTSIKMAGNKLDEAIIKYISAKYKIIIGEKTAEQAKMQIANVFDPDENKKMIVKGRHLLRGLPQSLEISEVDIYEAVIDHVNEIIAGVKNVLERTPPELVGDILASGIVLTGGGALLNGLDKLIQKVIGAPCYVADDALKCVAKGVEAAFNLSDELLDGFEKISLYRYK